jgi:competence protein ComEA
MRRALASDHQAAVARRLELLSAELATVRGEGPSARPQLRVAGAEERPPVEGSGAGDDGLGAEAWVPGGPTHVRASPWAPDGSQTADPVVAHVPGRHASRRVPTPGWSTGGPADALRARWALGPGQVTVVALGAVLALVLACWWLVRSGGHEVGVPAALPVDASSALATPADAPGAGDAGGRDPAAAATGGSRLVVDVTGRVRHPGIVVLRSGSRVVDALRAAGGARPGTRLTSLNLARLLTDGEQIVVGGATPGGPPVTGPGPAGSPVAGLVDLNTADQTALESLPEVGPVTAQAIIAWRTEHGGFTAVSQLLDVDGIGDATLAKITPYVTV